jgi:DNA-binding CsgD family transcriptional regulator
VSAVFGRAPELEAADRFLDGAAGRFGVLLLEGAAGIGKTTVWREAVRRAEERGFRVLSCRPAEAEAKLAMAAVADLFEPVAGDALATLPGPQRHALEVALLRAEPDAGPLDPRTLATALRTLVAELGSDRPLIVAIDDVQWLDPASATVLEFALRRLGNTPVGWLFARRLPERGRLRAEALVPPESFTRVTIGSLSLAALHHVVKERLGQPLSRSLLVRVHEAAGGNPFYAIEIARELLAVNELPAGGTALPVPDDLRELVSRRLRRLPRETGEALLTAAALSNPTTALVDEAALGAAEEQDIVRIAEDGRVAFQHPLYASAVYGAASRARRRSLHARLAELVGDLEQGARHLALATAEPDEQVARRLEEGAGLARSRGAWGSAAELLEQARRLTPPSRPAEAHRRAIAAAQHHVSAGDRSRARGLLEETLAAQLARSQRAAALHALGEIAYNAENFVEAKRLFTEAREFAEDPRIAFGIELGLAYVESNLWDFHGGAVHAYRALELADGIGEDGLLAQALGYCAMFDYLCGRGVDWGKVERSLELEDPDMLVPLQGRPAVIAACLTLYAGDLSDARGRFVAATTVARQRDDESDLAFLVLWHSWLETRAGDLVEAASLADDAASLATLSGSESMHAWALTQRALVHAHRGEVAETRRGCAEAATLVERSANRLPTIWIAASLALLELSLGDAGAAWRACEPLTGALEQQGIGEPIIPFFLPVALEALIADGEIVRAERLLDAFEEQGRRLDRAWALATGGRCRGLLLAARGDVAGAATALEEALARHERLGMPFEQARTLLVAGAVERRRRRRGRAKECFERALETFEELGARLWAERAHEELARVGLRRSVGDDLTPAERRVAELAAQGLTNREVAAALFISPKTVEANLARCYRKLGIASRAELGARMSDPVQG